MSTGSRTPSHFIHTCSPGSAVPLLEQGDHLSLAEFERRYDACPDLKKAELIHGVVHMSAAVRFYQHGRPHARLVAWLSMYEMDTPGVMVADNASVRLDDSNECQPDALMMLAPDCGGNATIDEDDYIRGAPEFVAEVASSSVSFDLHTKRDLYRNMNVREYLVWRVRDKVIDWFELHDGNYATLPSDSSGIIRSRVFPGLWLDAPAMLENRMSQVKMTLQEGLSGDAHRDFASRFSS